MRPPRLIFSVDTELSNFPQNQGLWGTAQGESWGLTRLLDLFAEVAVQATFFLDVYGRSQNDVSQEQRAAELIAARGHDLQLHTHPGPAFDSARPLLRHYSLEEQIEILEFGRQRIKQWTGHVVDVHRAGDWGADHISLQALARCNFLADFSACAWSDNCAIGQHVVSGNGWVRADGMLCGVGTGFRDALTGRLRRADLGGASQVELEEILGSRVDPLILTLHSFSLLQYNRARTAFHGNPDYITMLRRFLGLARERYGYECLSARAASVELANVPDVSLPWAQLPTTSLVSSTFGIVHSLKNRAYSYIR